MLLISRVVCVLSYVLFTLLSPFLPLISILLSDFYPLWLIEVMQVIHDVKTHFIATQRVFKNGQENIRKQGFKTHQGLFKTYLAKTRFNFSCKSKATKACNRYALPSQLVTVLHQNRNKFFQLGTAKKVAV